MNNDNTGWPKSAPLLSLQLLQNINYLLLLR